jgi:hypothetical protein
LGRKFLPLVGVFTIAVRLSEKSIKLPIKGGVRSLVPLGMTPKICHSAGNYLAAC